MWCDRPTNRLPMHTLRDPSVMSTHHRKCIYTFVQDKLQILLVQTIYLLANLYEKIHWTVTLNAKATQLFPRAILSPYEHHHHQHVSIVWWFYSATELSGREIELQKSTLFKSTGVTQFQTHFSNFGKSIPAMLLQWPSYGYKIHWCFERPRLIQQISVCCVRG